MSNNTEEFVTATLSKLENILDTNSIIGEPLKLSENITIVPVCKMTMGIIGGGSSIGKDKLKAVKFNNFAGGSGTGISYQPIGVIASVKDELKYINLNDSVPYFEIIDVINNITKNVKMEKHNDKK